MKLMKTEDAVGQILCHDITQIIKGVTKDAVFRKGHVIQEEDIPILLSVGKDHIYIWENNENICFSEQLEEKLDGIGGGYHFTINHKTHTDSAEIVCMSPFEHTHISWNGNVLYCTDFYDFSAGNVKEDRLLDIFRNENSDVFRREILKGNCATCNHCSWRDSRG